jgi:hypothetical protein
MKQKATSHPGMVVFGGLPLGVAGVDHAVAFVAGGGSLLRMAVDHITNYFAGDVRRGDHLEMEIPVEAGIPLASFNDVVKMQADGLLAPADFESLFKLSIITWLEGNDPDGHILVCNNQRVSGFHVKVLTREELEQWSAANKQDEDDIIVTKEASVVLGSSGFASAFVDFLETGPGDRSAPAQLAAENTREVVYTLIAAATEDPGVVAALDGNAPIGFRITRREEGGVAFYKIVVRRPTNWRKFETHVTVAELYNKCNEHMHTPFGTTGTMLLTQFAECPFGRIRSAAQCGLDVPEDYGFLLEDVALLPAPKIYSLLMSVPHRLFQGGKWIHGPLEKYHRRRSWVRFIPPNDSKADWWWDIVDCVWRSDERALLPRAVYSTGTMRMDYVWERFRHRTQKWVPLFTAAFSEEFRQLASVDRPADEVGMSMLKLIEHAYRQGYPQLGWKYVYTINEHRYTIDFVNMFQIDIDESVTDHHNPNIRRGYVPLLPSGREAQREPGDTPPRSSIRRRFVGIVNVTT